MLKSPGSMRRSLPSCVSKMIGPNFDPAAQAPANRVEWSKRLRRAEGSPCRLPWPSHYPSPRPDLARLLFEWNEGSRLVDIASSVDRDEVIAIGALRANRDRRAANRLFEERIPGTGAGAIVDVQELAGLTPR